MKELPEKLGEKNYFDLNDSVRGLILVGRNQVIEEISDTVNEILDYLESQKEGKLTGAGANWLEEGEEINS